MDKNELREIFSKFMDQIFERAVASKKPDGWITGQFKLTQGIMTELGRAGFKISILQTERFIHTVMHAAATTAQEVVTEEWAKDIYIYAVVEDLLAAIPESEGE